MGMPRLASSADMLREKKESRKTRLAQEFDTGFDKKIFFPSLRNKRKKKDKS